MNLKNINNKFLKLILLFSILAFIIILPLTLLLIESDIKSVAVPHIDINSYEILAKDSITQDIIIDKGLKKVSLLVANGARAINEGTVEISISQNNIVESQQFDISSIGDWVNIDLNIDYSKFKNGLATIETGKSIYFNFVGSTNMSDLPKARLNGGYLQGPLCIEYEEYTNSIDHEYRIVILSLIFIFVGILSYRMTYKEENDSKEYIFIFTMIIIALVTAFQYPTLTFKAEAWAESATHFYKLASEESVMKNLTTLEGGLYISLFNALLSLISVKVLSLGRNYILFTQLCALVFSASCSSIFCLKYFRKYFSDFSRVLLSIFVGIFLFDGEFRAFIGISYFAIILIIGLCLYDMKQINKVKYIILCLLTSIICLSKMSYVILFPAAIIALVLFLKQLDIRKRNYLIIIAVCSFLEGVLSLIMKKLDSTSLIGGTNLGDISIPPILDLIEKTIYYFIQIIYSMFIRKNDLNYPYMINLFLMLMLFLSVGSSVYWIYTKNKYEIYGKIILTLYVLAIGQCGLSLISNASINPVSDISWNSNVIIYQNRHFIFSYISMIFIFIIYLFILKGYMSDKIRPNISNKFISYAEVVVVVCSMIIYCNYYTLNNVDDLTNTELSHSDWKSYSKVLNEDTYCIRVAPEGWFLTKNSLVSSINNDNDIYNEVDISEVGNKSKGVIAIYANKYLYTNQLSNRKYVMSMYDGNNNKISEVVQSNDEFREYIGFIIDYPDKKVARIEFTYEDGTPAYVQNKLYLAREEN